MNSEQFPVLIVELARTLLVPMGAIFLLIMYIAALAYMLRRLPSGRKFLERFGRLFFYDENRDSRTSIREELFELSQELEKLKKSGATIGQSQAQQLQARISSFIDENFDSHLRARLADRESLDQELKAHLEETFSENIESVLKNLDISETMAAKDAAERRKASSLASETLEQFVDQERRSAGTLKTVMVNLFVVFNLVLLASIFFGLGNTLPAPLAYSIAASYLSLAAFIIYIIRASHFRTGVLLAIRENIVNQTKAFDYLYSAKCASPLSENEIELVRMILTNRTEREQQAKHPYEVVLKQIEGSNIQFRGGKMQLGSKKDA
jgi:hypothetical protein